MYSSILYKQLLIVRFKFSYHQSTNIKPNYYWFIVKQTFIPKPASFQIFQFVQYHISFVITVWITTRADHNRTTWIFKLIIVCTDRKAKHNCRLKAQGKIWLEFKIQNIAVIKCFRWDFLIGLYPIVRLFNDCLKTHWLEVSLGDPLQIWNVTSSFITTTKLTVFGKNIFHHRVSLIVLIVHPLLRIFLLYCYKRDFMLHLSF